MGHLSGPSQARPGTLSNRQPEHFDPFDDPAVVEVDAALQGLPGEAAGTQHAAAADALPAAMRSSAAAPAPPNAASALSDEPAAEQEHGCLPVDMAAAAAQSATAAPLPPAPMHAAAAAPEHGAQAAEGGSGNGGSNQAVAALMEALDAANAGEAGEQLQRRLADQQQLLLEQTMYDGENAGRTSAIAAELLQQMMHQHEAAAGTGAAAAGLLQQALPQQALPQQALPQQALPQLHQLSATASALEGQGDSMTASAEGGKPRAARRPSGTGAKKALQPEPEGKMGKSNLRGVFWDRKTGRWRSQLGYQNRKVFMGYFNNPEDAARAYDKKLIELHGITGASSRTNYPLTTYMSEQEIEAMVKAEEEERSAPAGAAALTASEEEALGGHAHYASGGLMQGEAGAEGGGGQEGGEAGAEGAHRSGRSKRRAPGRLRSFEWELGDPMVIVGEDGVAQPPDQDQQFDQQFDQHKGAVTASTASTEPLAQWWVGQHEQAGAAAAGNGQHGKDEGKGEVEGEGATPPAKRARLPLIAYDLEEDAASGQKERQQQQEWAAAVAAAGLAPTPQQQPALPAAQQREGMEWEHGGSGSSSGNAADAGDMGEGGDHSDENYGEQADEDLGRTESGAFAAAQALWGLKESAPSGEHPEEEGAARGARGSGHGGSAWRGGRHAAADAAPVGPVGTGPGRTSGQPRDAFGRFLSNRSGSRGGGGGRGLSSLREGGHSSRRGGGALGSSSGGGGGAGVGSSRRIFTRRNAQAGLGGGGRGRGRGGGSSMGQVRQQEEWGIPHLTSHQQQQQQQGFAPAGAGDGALGEGPSMGLLMNRLLSSMAALPEAQRQAVAAQDAGALMAALAPQLQQQVQPAEAPAVTGRARKQEGAPTLAALLQAVAPTLQSAPGAWSEHAAAQAPPQVSSDGWLTVPRAGALSAPLPPASEPLLPPQQHQAGRPGQKTSSLTMLARALAGGVPEAAAPPPPPPPQAGAHAPWAPLLPPPPQQQQQQVEDVHFLDVLVLPAGVVSSMDRDELRSTVMAQVQPLLSSLPPAAHRQTLVVPMAVPYSIAFGADGAALPQRQQVGIAELANWVHNIAKGGPGGGSGSGIARGGAGGGGSGGRAAVQGAQQQLHPSSMASPRAGRGSLQVLQHPGLPSMSPRGRGLPTPRSQAQRDGSAPATPAAVMIGGLPRQNSTPQLVAAPAPAAPPPAAMAAPAMSAPASMPASSAPLAVGAAPAELQAFRTLHQLLSSALPAAGSSDGGGSGGGYGAGSQPHEQMISMLLSALQQQQQQQQQQQAAELR